MEELEKRVVHLERQMDRQEGKAWKHQCDRLFEIGWFIWIKRGRRGYVGLTADIAGEPTAIPLVSDKCPFCGESYTS